MRFIFLSNKFYNDFSACREILQKRTRPYLCLTVEIDGVRFAIPLRHRVTHKYCFHTIGDAALDYTKAVVIRSAGDISPIMVQIDQATYNILKTKEQKIENGFRNYLKLYKKALSYPNNPHYSFIRTCSALQYFIKSNPPKNAAALRFQSDL